MERSGDDDTRHQYGGSSGRRSREALLAGFIERARDSDSSDSFLIRNDLSIEAPFSQSLAEFCGLELYEAVNVTFEPRRGSKSEKRENIQVEQEEETVSGSCGNDQMAFLDDQSKRVDVVEEEEENDCDRDGDGMATVCDHESVERSHEQESYDDAFRLDNVDWPLLGCDCGVEDQSARSMIKNQQTDCTSRGETSTMQPGTISASSTVLDFEYLLELFRKTLVFLKLFRGT